MNLEDLKKLVKLKPWVNAGEAAAFLNVSRERVRVMILEGKLETIAFLGARHVRLTSVIARLERRAKLAKKEGRLPQ